MQSSRTALLISAMLISTSVVALALRPDTRVADIAQISLESMIPHQVGDWQEDPQRTAQVVNPQTQAMLSKLYSQLLVRVYVDHEGYRIMLSLAYGSDQRGTLQAHKPEVCYPAQGFTLHSNDLVPLSTPFGEIPAQRLSTTRGPRTEPVTYWYTVGDTAVQTKLQKRLVDLRYGLTGQIPDGMLFRVSSIDANQDRARRKQDHFVNQLLLAISPADRKRVSGLNAP